jgi:hypothetical protein
MQLVNLPFGMISLLETTASTHKCNSKGHYRHRINYAMLRTTANIMQCVAYIWNSSDYEGNTFLLCLSPLGSVEGGAPTEAFVNERALSHRLSEVGFSASSVATSLSSLRNGRDSTSSNLEVSQRVFDSFGRYSSFLRCSQTVEDCQVGGPL